MYKAFAKADKQRTWLMKRLFDAQTQLQEAKAIKYNRLPFLV
jgi:hypothetical protein